MPSGEKNGRWKGGEWVNSSGYVMVHVGKDHPMASCRAYAKRCRLVCYETHGMPEPGQHAHHIDGDKTHDVGDNLRWEWPTEHGQLHLTPERARKIGAKGGRAAARKRRREARAAAAARKKRRRTRRIAA